MLWEGTELQQYLTARWEIGEVGKERLQKAGMRKGQRLWSGVGGEKAMGSWEYRGKKAA